MLDKDKLVGHLQKSRNKILRTKLQHFSELQNTIVVTSIKIIDEIIAQIQSGRFDKEVNEEYDTLVKDAIYHLLESDLQEENGWSEKDIRQLKEMSKDDVNLNIHITKKYGGKLI